VFSFMPIAESGEKKSHAPRSSTRSTAMELQLLSISDRSNLPEYKSRAKRRGDPLPLTSHYICRFLLISSAADSTMTCFSRLLSLLALTTLAGCSRPPEANLQLVDIAGHYSSYKIRFDSDVDFLSMYKDSRWHPVTSQGMICSLEKEPDFGTDHDHINPVHGLVEFLGERMEGSRMIYRFTSRLIFYAHSGSNPAMPQILGPTEIRNLLASGPALTCKVRILMYFTPRYFTRAFKSPTDHLQQLAQGWNANREVP
jgi:hypothetical protein